MGVDHSTAVYLPNYEYWARDIQVTPIASQPGQPAYWARGIYDTQGMVRLLHEEVAILSDQQTIIDIREIEFGVIPQQGDHISVPADTGAMGMVGPFEVTDAYTNGGGETTLVVRKWEPAAP
jgi:hypothetical protein